jgi:hypothetical protein
LVRTLADVWFDTGTGQPLPADHPLAAKRAEVDAKSSKTCSATIKIAGGALP